MAERQLDGMAAPDPANPGQFVAALLISGVQLLEAGCDGLKTPAAASREQPCAVA